jgi:hypothetical protein
MIDQMEFRLSACPPSCLIGLMPTVIEISHALTLYNAGFNMLDIDNDGYITKDEFNYASGRR